MNNKANFLKWFGLVFSNTLWGLALGLDKVQNWQGRLGIALGIFVITVLYYSLDKWLLTKGQKLLSKALQRGVILTALLNLMPFIPVLCGILALDGTSWLLSDRGYFLSFFTTVLIDGLLLSIFAIIPVFIMWLIIKNSHNKSLSNEQ